MYTISDLTLNFSKCSFSYIANKKDCTPIFTHNISQKTFIKILGVNISDDLKWNHHINQIHTVASRRFYVYRILKAFLLLIYKSKTDLLSISLSFVRSILEYACPLFVGLDNKNGSILKSIQSRFHNVTTILQL